MTLRLTSRYSGSVPIEAPCVAPDRLAGLSPDQIAKLPVQHGNVSAQLGEFVTVDGDPSDADVVLDGEWARIKWIGAHMANGRMTIHGNASTHVGSGMSGGAIEIYGDVDDWCGAEMRGGSIRIHGSVSNHAGAAYPGSRRGMRGGTLLIDGSAGDQLGAVMRRGLITVGGGIGDYAAAGMVAGTVFAFGPVGRNPAAGMKRGVLAAFSPEIEPLPTFRFDCSYRPTFIDLYLRRLHSIGWPVPNLEMCPFRRYRGDLAARGLGEILIRSG